MMVVTLSPLIGCLINEPESNNPCGIPIIMDNHKVSCFEGCGSDMRLMSVDWVSSGLRRYLPTFNPNYHYVPQKLNAVGCTTLAMCLSCKANGWLQG